MSDLEVAELAITAVKDAGSGDLNLLNIAGGAKNSALDTSAIKGQSDEGGLRDFWNYHSKVRKLVTASHEFAAQQAESDALRATPGYRDAKKSIASQLVRTTMSDAVGNLEGTLNPTDFKMSRSLEKLAPEVLHQAFNDSLDGLRGAGWQIDIEGDAEVVSHTSRFSLPFRKAPSEERSFTFPKTTIRGVPIQTYDHGILIAFDSNADDRELFDSVMPTPNDVMPAKLAQFEKYVVPFANRISEQLISRTELDGLGNLEGVHIPTASGQDANLSPAAARQALDYSLNSLRESEWTVVETADEDGKSLFPKVIIRGVPKEPEHGAAVASELNAEFRSKGYAQFVAERDNATADLTAAHSELFASSIPTPDDVLGDRLARAERSRASGEYLQAKYDAERAEEDRKAVSLAQFLTRQAELTPDGDLRAVKVYNYSDSWRDVLHRHHRILDVLGTKLDEAGWDVKVHEDVSYPDVTSIEIRGIPNSAIAPRTDGIKKPAEALEYLQASDSELKDDPYAFDKATATLRAAGKDDEAAIVDGWRSLPGTLREAEADVFVHDSAYPFIHPSVEFNKPLTIIGPRVKVGQGSQVAGFVEEDAEVGQNVKFWGFESFSTVGKGATISDDASLRRDVSVGDGAIVEHGSVIGDGVTVGRNARAAGYVKAGTVIPSRPDPATDQS